MNKKVKYWIVFLFFFLVSGCSLLPAGQATETVAPSPTNPPDPVAHVTPAPNVLLTARAYLDGWKKDDYEGMYSLLTSVSQDAVEKEKFIKQYQSVASETGSSGLDYEILSTLTNPDSAQVNYRVTLHSVLVGDVSRDTMMNLSREKGEWRVQWDDTLVLPELKGGNYLAMDRVDYTPARANIYDLYGRALVAQADATALGLYPDQIDPDQYEAVFENLTYLTGLSAEALQNLYANFPPGANWYLPLGEVSAAKVGRRYDILTGLAGVVMRAYKSRFYFDGGVAPHVVGYVSAIQPDELEAYKRRGYLQDERVGRTGLEKWGEEYLSGKRGGALYVFNSQGQPITRLAERAAEPSQEIFTTIDRDLQLAAQKSLNTMKGAVVVLEKDTGRVLAMASSPGFDPNAFEPVNFNSYTLLTLMNQDSGQPLYNRAARGQYPLGSVFKIITMATALDTGRFTPESTYECGYLFTELPGVELKDWTYQHFQNDGRTAPSGLLTLPQGLIRSCNPWFYHIGLDLYNQGMTNKLTEMARGFGLGSATGIEGVEEDAGQVPDPANPMDATNLAIGQGALMVTPLQVADFIAAVGNGGTLYTPQVINKIAPPDGEPTYSFTPKVRGTLPIKPATLKVIQEAMVGVVTSAKPRGTAAHVFSGLDIPVAAKTGTAETSNGLPHAWFGGYTFANREDKPDIAIAVIVENIGEGSDYAAPIFRRLVEVYFRGTPGKLFPWETGYYVVRTPEPPPTETPTPGP